MIGGSLGYWMDVKDFLGAGRWGGGGVLAEGLPRSVADTDQDLDLLAVSSAEMAAECQAVLIDLPG